MKRETLLQLLDSTLEPWRFKDYGPNGLQVEGKSEIRKLVSGVTASVALIEAAIAAQADAIIVHHGLFWRGQTGVVTGWMRQRLALLLAHNINLIAYHLPLDAHPKWGNNAQLGQLWGFETSAYFGEQNLGCCADIHAKPFDNARLLAKHVEELLHHQVTLIEGDGRPIKRVAWCSGGAQNYFEAAIAQGADAFITGEISEPQAHYARESGVAFLAAGHHATERYGAPALAGFAAHNLGLVHAFIDIDNPA